MNYLYYDCGCVYTEDEGQYDSETLCEKHQKEIEK